MRIFAWRKFYISIALSLLLFVSPAIAQEEEDAPQVSSSPLKLIQEKYDGLPDKGKLAAGAAVAAGLPFAKITGPGMWHSMFSHMFGKFVRFEYETILSMSYSPAALQLGRPDHCLDASGRHSGLRRRILRTRPAGCQAVLCPGGAASSIFVSENASFN